MFSIGTSATAQERSGHVLFEHEDFVVRIVLDHGMDHCGGSSDTRQIASEERHEVASAAKASLYSIQHICGQPTLPYVIRNLGFTGSMQR